MSLYIGKLSGRTRKDELERVFRRYGQCEVRMKDGYGFVVYDFPPDAESALSALRGRNICGQQLTITWSNKQPRAFQRHARGANSYEARGRDSFSRRKSNDWRERDYRSGFKQSESDGGRLNSVQDMLDEGRDYRQEDMIDNDCIGEEHHDLKEDIQRDGGDVVTKMVDNGRWGEQVDDPLNDHDGMTFDHYDPYQGYDRKDKDGNRWTENPDAFAPVSSQDKVGREWDGDTVMKRPNDPKFQQNCFSCGALGHKMRDCPRKHSSRRKFTRSDRSQNDDINTSRGGGELERFGSKSRGNTRPSRPTKLRHRSDRLTSDSGQLQMSMKNVNSPETDRVQGKEHGGKKRSKRETRSPKRHSTKKSKRFASPSFHLQYTASRSHSASKSSKSLTRSISPSRSRSILVSGARSLSSTSKSGSKSRYSKPRNSKSRSRSSSPTSLSLSVSLGRPTSSPSKAQFNHKESLDKATTPESRDMQGQQAKLKEGDVYSENTDIATDLAAVNDENAVPASRLEDDMVNTRHLQGDENIISRSLLEVTSPGTSLPEKRALGTGPSPPEVYREQTKSDALVRDDTGRPTAKPNLETPYNTCSDPKTSISVEEMCMALKHYDVELPGDHEKRTSLEALFGSARLWPWESIYYRRVKKGPVSVENYARRIAQNQEFGIVDKYIRSSSGWGEICGDNP